jgi:hypothetical protein
MAYRKYVETAFGNGLVAEKVLEMRERDLLKNLVTRVVSFYDKYAALDTPLVWKAQRYADSIYSECGPWYAYKPLPEGEMYISSIIRNIACEVKQMSKDDFVAKYTTNDGMTLLNKLKVNRAFMLYDSFKG